MLYPEICTNCGAPARIETLSDERLGVEDYQFCINIHCPFYDRKTAELEQRQRTIKQNRVATAPKKQLPLKELLNPVDEVAS